MMLSEFVERTGWLTSRPSLTGNWNGSPMSSRRTSPRPNIRNWPSALIAGLPAI